MQERQILNRISKAEKRIVDLYKKLLSGGVGGFQTLANVLVTGQRTGGNDIIVDDADAIQLNNTSSLRKGTYNYGGNGGISRLCSNNYEDMWQNGFRHVFDQSGFIRQSTNCFSEIPSANFDETLRFKVGSFWTLDNGTTYRCIDNTTGAAVWELYFSTVPKYKVYTILLTQTGEGDPQVTELENTLGVTPIWTYDTTGFYQTDWVFGTNFRKIYYNITNKGSVAHEFRIGFGQNGPNFSIFIQTFNSGVLTNGLLANTPIEVRVYN